MCKRFMPAWSFDRGKGQRLVEAGSPAHVAVRDIVCDKWLWKKIPYYLNCRSTAFLENFWNLILKYSSKWHSYTRPVYRARNRVAALDHNANCTREAAKRTDGSLSGTTVNKWSMICLPSATGKAVPKCSRYFETVRTEHNHWSRGHE